MNPVCPKVMLHRLRELSLCNKRMLEGGIHATWEIPSQVYGLTLVGRHWAGGGDLLPALDVAGEAADLADDALPRQADHDGGAVVALQRRRERPDEELVRFRLRAHLESIHQI